MTPQARPLGELVRLLEARGLLRGIPAASAFEGSLAIRDVTLDSRAARTGSLFVAVAGARVDGHDFAAAAVAAGAQAVIGERVIVGVEVPQMVVSDARAALAVSAAWLHGFPSHAMTVIGVTGTDGKTSTSFMLRGMLEACGRSTGLLSTVTVIAGGRVIGGSRATTPEAPVLQASLAAMRDAGDRCAVVESTSHGLAQQRVAEVAYDIAVLTNLSHEHLEFHGTFEAYKAAKRSLFERLAVGDSNPEKGLGKWAVVNLDDTVAGEYAAAARQAGASVIGYGAADAEVRLARLAETAGGLILGIDTPRWAGELRLRMAGRFNAHNAMAALAVGEALQLDPEAMRAGLESLEGVPGRMQRIDVGQPFAVVVDYAHTPDSLAKVLDNLAPSAAAGGGGLVCVFGSAGERDTLKRPMMGRVAGERCRLIVLTDEDPRGEDRMTILREIAAGAEAVGRRQNQDLMLVPDRRDAIHQAFGAARPGDVVVLCGKGHESTIEMADEAMPWDEAQAAREALVELGYGRE
ncbi:MAG TPA: UDP-N-acetylmuramoyl-L-alanyl-D-glutamate--2,6-diaminopimelate ligase [Candidatus Limnocylindrales bacterium]|nr:UDP-N-acetylmuramoyl-L-alanyl-D-glutamate--2,6-diaminopimelate ligase [Candidatus Limnocylindrales bacterium]